MHNLQRLHQKPIKYLYYKPTTLCFLGKVL